MDCKNCARPLRTDYSFCAHCGAKVIRNRITIKSLWYDFTERFFNLDNTFLKTFKHLFSRPDDVIVGYIKGVRKKYLNPVSYFTIAIMLGGLFVYVHNEFFPDALNFKFLYPDESTLTDSEKFGMDFQKRINYYLFKYQSLFYVAMLPFLALISRLVFINRKQFNLSEHFVMNIYAYSQMSIVINSVYILLLWNSKALYYASIGNLVLQIGYFTWVFYKIFNLSIKQTLIKLLFFLLILAVVFFGLMIVASLYLVFMTDTFQNMAPK
ncbi:DUF3667 domain-containing protein [Aggregatimonas sangjinii]|uniref:DUF3667 domain-containing protein n=1 Tax=Aggregatimonas sangjinii TaxID=2583587 RepID=A0A5B7SVM0_9FLAO|nr:DUF3667 domain-containing protein [Aggregatimonas sangjinii]QCX00890.1 DUF3667 domain-containing protein [Aggregatimonas sangjinii]